MADPQPNEMHENVSNPDFWYKRLAPLYDESISDEKRKELKKKLCNDWLISSAMAGEEAEKKILEIVDSRFIHFEGVFTDGIKTIFDSLEELRREYTEKHREIEFKRKEDSQRLDQYEYRLKLAEQQQGHSANILNQVLSSQTNTQKSIDSIQTLLLEHHVKDKPKAGKFDFIAKLTAPAWAAIVIMLALTLSAVTGHLSEALSLLGDWTKKGS